MQVITKLHSILKPFLLRRVKSDVENSLPGKKEFVLYAQMTQQQQDFNEELRQNTLNVGAAHCLHLAHVSLAPCFSAGCHGLGWNYACQGWMYGVRLHVWLCSGVIVGMLCNLSESHPACCYR